ncbi:Meiosis-specific protein ASY1 [Camellia lanceoleosa]|uniref:Meiosis-specific protein ASY1 n=1 Tax=Camellia lanceoleosa TaxID=1840588 RepID=A0ACC0HU50_9ERIC|nr:Meiosis-specific protein ASY1 [Camellia lanceoleosa]
MMANAVAGCTADNDLSLASLRQSAFTHCLVAEKKLGINRDMSTCGMLYSIGSDLKHTWGRSETYQNGSIRSEQNGLRARDYGNTPTSRAEALIRQLGDFLRTFHIQTLW